MVARIKQRTKDGTPRTQHGGQHRTLDIGHRTEDPGYRSWYGGQHRTLDRGLKTQDNGLDHGQRTEDRRAKSKNRL